ncbi:sorting nexin 2B-like [Phalaenopsis equestris]|uniref:sorting nexin 2B-like n=1 Tax=Phalaenopsis equestris TaxID=78828 RepID=UPI0009E5C111|nr:sorting nexin 2B-like [Phalaenopsis equestris]
MQAESLVKTQHDLGEAMGELGLAFIKLIKLENDEAIYASQRVGAADAKIVATAAVKASRFYRELNSQTIKHLDTLHEHMGLMLSIQNAFSERSNALLTVQTLLSDLSSLRARAEKLEAASARVFGSDESRMQKLDVIRRTIMVTEDKRDCATREYERIKSIIGQFWSKYYVTSRELFDKIIECFSAADWACFKIAENPLLVVGVNLVSWKNKKFNVMS